VIESPPRDPPALVNLASLAEAVPGAVVLGNPEIAIRRVVFDSRQVGASDLFVALPGTVVDGAQYVAQAFANGAAAAVVERPDVLPVGLPGLVVPSARRALGLLSAQREGWPSRQLRVVGVTGTDGKTTTSSLIASILRQAGRRVGLVSTVRAEIGDDALDTGFHTTTPDAPDLQRYLRLMVERDTQDAVLEVTSHGLAQGRVTGVDFDVAVITNVTGDHLDFHGTVDEYLAAKLKLFEGLADSARKPGVPKGIVYNLDDRSAPRIAGLPSDRKLGYALEQAADVRARAVRLYAGASSFDAVTPAGAFSVVVPLPGWYNVANALAAIAAGFVLDAPTEAIQRGLAEFAGVPGRMEKIDLGQLFEVFVDFAHTPNSLEQVLSLARERGRRRVAVVFGCAGRRDRQKRPVMGEIAARFADRIYLTAEDPRTESLDAIIEAIAEGCRRAGRREGVDFWRVPDRAEAIERAIAEAEEGDLVLVTGKGHERSMCFGQTEVPWSDQDAVRQALERRLAATA
jgi:UDP-N-acetylmuramoyl-L-alanyl-D-glutamate--2,6-diaminopimelate ligase